MQVKVITLEFSSLLDRFDDAPLREFIKDKQVLNVRDHFFLHNDAPHLAIVVTYRVSQNDGIPGKRRPKRAEDWRKLIKESDMPVFNSLRDWRSERAKRDGVPPYIICTNRQLASVVKDRPSGLSQLAKIEGFGEGKLKKYGKELLGALSRSNGATEGPASEAEKESGGE